jgi:hypothetical protein
MDWSKGLSASYKAYIVDPITWKDTEKIDIISGSISKSEDDLRESADITVSDYNSTKEQWIRVYLDARQTADSYYGAIFTGLISSPGKEIEGNVQTNSLRCYSVLKPASDILLPRGYYVTYGTNTVNILKSLLTVIKGIPIVIEGTPPNLSQTIIAESGESNLSMADKILYSIGWRMCIRGDGAMVISEPASTPSAYFDPVDVDSLELKVNIENNWFDCPNVFRAVQGNFSATARDEDPGSIFSIPSRGREIYFEETSCTPYIGESLAHYAKRRLKEEQQVYMTATYSRRFEPNANVSDVISLRYPGQGLDGLFYISSQTVTLGYSPTVSEVAYKL